MNNEITNKVNLVIIIIGAFLGLTLTIFLLCNRSEKNKANIYLGLLILCSLAYFGPGFFYRFDLLGGLVHTIGYTEIINYLIGPLTYLYVRACTQEGHKMKPVLWLHFLPFFLFTLYRLPFLLSSGQEKLDYFFLAVEENQIAASQPQLLIVSLHVLVYFGLSIQLLAKYKKHLNNSTSSVTHYYYYWVLVFMGIHFLPVFSMIIGFVFSSLGQYTIMTVLMSFFIFSLAVFLAVLIQPQLFHAFPHRMPILEPNSEEKKKYENSSLQKEQKESYLKKLIHHVEFNKAYLEPELTLAQLSEQTNIPAHYVSQVINEELNYNFLEFINRYRIDEVKNKFANHDFDNFTIIAIAYEAGFNSKSAFYTAFKKNVGTTPSSFRKSLLHPV